MQFILLKLYWVVFHCMTFLSMMLSAFRLFEDPTDILLLKVRPLVP